MKIPLRWPSVGLLVSAVLLSVVGCERLVFADGELEARDRFSKVPHGTTETELVAAIGEPFGVLSRSSRSNPMSYKRRGIQGDCSPIAPFQNCGELKLLPREIDAPTVFVYQEGTVFAYYFLDHSGRVLRVKVRIS